MQLFHCIGMLIKNLMDRQSPRVLDMVAYLKILKKALIKEKELEPLLKSL